jgi:regulation of enolase protein 1 (concanavalin A-like superfamily)
MRAMATVTEIPKVHNAFRATIYDQAGTLVIVDGQIWFMTDDEVVPFEVEMAPFTCVLGEVGISETQTLMDRLHGGAAAVACSREMGRN